MSWFPLIAIEGVLVFGSVMAWGLWELRVLRRETQRRQQREAEQKADQKADEKASENAIKDDAAS